MLETIQNLPNSSGVYKYFDKNGRLLYVGKAKNLKNRVKSYFKFTPHLAPSPRLSHRITKMIEEANKLEYIVVDDENDALILENTLIKQLNPKYNILLRDDKTYPYIYIDLNQEFPRFDITRKVQKGSKIKYFGPYSSGARDILTSIYDLLPLVQKKSCAKGKKACLFYQMKKCLAPCEGKVSRDEYASVVKEGLNLIQNKEKIIQSLEKKMCTLSEELRFEEALELKNRVINIEKSQIKSSLDLANKTDIDIFAIKSDDSKTVILKMFIRDGKLISSDHKFLQTITDEVDELYTNLIVNHYRNGVLVKPDEILLLDDLEEIDSLESFVHKAISKKVKIHKAKIGIKKEILNMASNNCDELLKQKPSKNANIAREVKELFELEYIPNRIESFDNSHMMGQATVGAMVVYDDGFKKSEYREYHLESKDEYSQMREMLSRRALKFDENFAPNLWVIDGGKALFDLACEVVQSSGVFVDVIAIAKEKVDAKAIRANRSKGSARDVIHSKNREFRLEPTDKRLQFIQRQRDEAHATALKYHKRLKQKEDKQISLLSKKGIGEAKIKKLISYYGTFEAIENANEDEIKEVLSKR
jgi:excinuclease ABC subunit C